MLRSVLTLLVILLAAPAGAGNRSGGGLHGGGFHGRFPGGGFPVAGSPSGGSGGGVVYGGHFHDDGFAFHRNMRRSRDLLVVYGYGYNCGFGLDCGVYNSGYGYGYGYGGGGPGNAVGGGAGLSGGGSPSSGGGYVPDPVGAEIPTVNFPSSCWVRRAGYDPAGASVGQVLIDLCHPSDNLTVTRVDARARPPNTGSGAPRSPQ